VSVITDVMLCASDSETAAVEHINAQMPSLCASGGRLEMVTDKDRFGGTKVPSRGAWGGAFNFLDFGSFIDAVKAAPWKFRSYVVLILWDEFDDSPHVVTLGP